MHLSTLCMAPLPTPGQYRGKGGAFDLVLTSELGGFDSAQIILHTKFACMLYQQSNPCILPHPLGGDRVGI